jgi:hypothetical protein
MRVLRLSLSVLGNSNILTNGYTLRAKALKAFNFGPSGVFKEGNISMYNTMYEIKVIVFYYTT